MNVLSFMLDHELHYACEALGLSTGVAQAWNKVRHGILSSEYVTRKRDFILNYFSPVEKALLDIEG